MGVSLDCGGERFYFQSDLSKTFNFLILELCSNTYVLQYAWNAVLILGQTSWFVIAHVQTLVTLK